MQNETFLHSLSEAPVFFISVYIPYEIPDTIEYGNRTYYWGMSQEDPDGGIWELPESVCEDKIDDEEEDDEDEHWLPEVKL